MDDTTRARLQTAAQGEMGWAWVSADDLRALLAAQAQAAPVLAAVERLMTVVEWDVETTREQAPEGYPALVAEVRDAWRAAREG